MRPALAYLISGGNDWRQGLLLLALGVAAYLFAQLHPAVLQIGWYQTLPLIWYAGALLVAAAWYMPSHRLIWWPIKLALVGATVHWAIVLPVHYYYWW